MTDLRIAPVVSGEAVTLDLLLTPSGALDTSQELATACIVALGTDRRAAEDDVLPDPTSQDRRGWWADADPDIWDSWPIGSRLWLLERAKIVGPGAREGATVARVEEYVREALQPFVDLRVASGLAVHAERTGTGRIDCTATLYRGPLPSVTLRYASLWDEIGA